MEAKEGSDSSARRASAPLSTSSSATRAAADYFEPVRPNEASRNASTPGTIYRHDSLAMVDEQEQRELQRLAADIARIQSTPTETGVPAPDAAAADAAAATDEKGIYAWHRDPAMDPSSKSFDLRKYLEHIVGLLRKEGIAQSQTGVTFKDLTVSGTCDAIQLQRTLADWAMLPVRLGEFLSFSKKATRTILNGMDGIVNSGELLLVLGRPGAGCSTLLKCMTGQLHGLTLDAPSVVHYNGIPQGQMMKEFRGEAIYNQEVRLVSPVRWVLQLLIVTSTGR